MGLAEETAVVSHVEGKFVYLNTQNNKGCGGCESKVSCGHVSALFALKPRTSLKLNNTLGLKRGDRVILGMPADKLLQATVLLYILPLLCLFVFSFLAKMWFGEVASIMAGLFGLIVGLGLIKLLTIKSTVVGRFQPQMLRKVIAVKSV